MKYPRTFHLRYSPGVTKDDKVMKNIDRWLEGDYKVIVSEKLDGENTSLHSNHIHARSEDSKSQPWRSHLKSVWANIKHKIPNNLQIVVEDMYAKHSIYYDRLTSYHYIIMIIDKETKMVLPFLDTLLWADELEIPMAPVYYEGEYNLFDCVRDIPMYSKFGEEMEGYVIRYSGEFPISEFPSRVGKWVRANHVETDEHWTRGWIKNKLIGD